jgi:hypothetical protein
MRDGGVRSIVGVKLSKEFKAYGVREPFKACHTITVTDYSFSQHITTSSVESGRP